MREMRTFVTLGAALAVLAALPAAAPPAAAQRRDQPAGWRDVATEQDRARIRNWRRSWTEALGQARRTHRADVAREGALLEPDAGLLSPEIAPGDYRCRTIKLGSRGNVPLTYISYPAFRCRVERDGAGLRFTKLTGSQRQIGHLYAGNPRRMIFLGTLQLGDERRVLRYGADSDRDSPGILERIGDRRWRLVFPRPTFESIVDVIELVPA